MRILILDVSLTLPCELKANKEDCFLFIFLVTGTLRDRTRQNLDYKNIFFTQIK